ncbi:MAG: hypothetical protein L0191_06370 [Acidobacteria bacterium]|nr:hypothetical protein [Acidobacteriota bacterium]
MTVETWIMRFIQDATGIGQLTLGVALILVVVQLRSLRTELQAIRGSLENAITKIGAHGEAIARLEGWLERHKDSP